MATTVKPPVAHKETIIPKSKMGSAEWVVIIVFFICMDLLQLILDALAVGVAVNRFIDILIGGCLIVYLWIRGELAWPATRNRIILAFLATFALEFFPVIDIAPFWTLDGLFCWNESRKRNALARAQEERFVKMNKEITAYETRNKIIAFRQKQMLIQEQRDQEILQKQEEKAVTEEV